jgi:hypothetical protein
MQKWAMSPTFQEDMLPPSSVADVINGRHKIYQSGRSGNQSRFETETFRINISCITPN